MDFTGIIAEYDPFHNGHAAQLAAVRAAGAQCIAVCMSSGAVQRGGVPILPESVRVRAALDAGADLVVALPAPYACATAEQFAAAGVHLLAALGCDTLAFGAETPDAAALLDTARLLDGEELNARIRQNLATGMTYAAARAAAADALHPGTGGLLRTPNNILGIEYCKALLGQNAPLRPVTIRREGSAHDGTLAPDTHPSASGLRALLRQGKREEALSLLPPAVARAYELEEAAGRAPVFWENSHRAILARLRSMTAADFAALDQGREGIWNRLYDASRAAASLPELLAAAKTKRYAMARLRRMVLWSYLGLTPGDMPERVPYLRVLAANGTGCRLLSRMREAAAVPVLTRPAQVRRLGPEARRLFELEVRATDLYTLAYPRLSAAGGTEWREGPVILGGPAPC